MGWKGVYFLSTPQGSWGKGFLGSLCSATFQIFRIKCHWAICPHQLISVPGQLKWIKVQQSWWERIFLLTVLFSLTVVLTRLLRELLSTSCDFWKIYCGYEVSCPSASILALSHKVHWETNVIPTGWFSQQENMSLESMNNICCYIFLIKWTNYFWVFWRLNSSFASSFWNHYSSVWLPTKMWN